MRGDRRRDVGGVLVMETTDRVFAPYMPRVAVLPFPGIENGYLCISGKRRRQALYGERWYPPNAQHDEQRERYSDDRLKTEPAVTFLYDAGNCCAEWDGAYGPIQLWFRCRADFKEEYAEARPHWFYPHAFGSGHWSQMAVDDECLPKKFSEGDYEAIFRALKQWAQSHNLDYENAREAA
jgi:hypothetical protein